MFDLWLDRAYKLAVIVASLKLLELLPNLF